MTFRIILQLIGNVVGIFNCFKMVAVWFLRLRNTAHSSGQLKVSIAKSACSSGCCWAYLSIGNLRLIGAFCLLFLWSWFINWAPKSVILDWFVHQSNWRSNAGLTIRKATLWYIHLDNRRWFFPLQIHLSRLFKYAIPLLCVHFMSPLHNIILCWRTFHIGAFFMDH